MPRLESTRELIRARAQQQKKWKETYSQIWKERACRSTRTVSPKWAPSRSPFERLQLELQMLDIGAEVKQRGCLSAIWPPMQSTARWVRSG